MHRVAEKLVELTGRDVEHTVLDGEHVFRLSLAQQPAHYLHVDADLAAAEGEAGVLARLDEVVPHLTTEGQALRVRLMPAHVLAEPAVD